MQVIIPLAGKGTRLRPHTHLVPKPMLKVAGRPVMDWVMDRLDGLDVSELIFITGHLKEQVEAYARARYPIPVALHRAEGAGRHRRRGQPGAAVRARAGADHLRGHGLRGRSHADQPHRRRRDHLGQGGRGLPALRRGGHRRAGLHDEDRREADDADLKLANIGLYYIRAVDSLWQGIDHVLAAPKNKGEYFLTDAFQYMIEHGKRILTAEVGGWYDCGKLDTLLETNEILLRKGAGPPARVPRRHHPRSRLHRGRRHDRAERDRPERLARAGHDGLRQPARQHHRRPRRARSRGVRLDGAMLGNGVVAEGLTGSASLGDHSEVTASPSTLTLRARCRRRRALPVLPGPQVPLRSGRRRARPAWSSHDGRLGQFDAAAVREHVAALRSVAGAVEELEVDDLQDEIDRTALLGELRSTDLPAGARAAPRAESGLLGQPSVPGPLRRARAAAARRPAGARRRRSSGSAAIPGVPRRGAGHARRAAVGVRRLGARHARRRRRAARAARRRAGRRSAGAAGRAAAPRRARRSRRSSGSAPRSATRSSPAPTRTPSPSARSSSRGGSTSSTRSCPARPSSGATGSTCRRRPPPQLAALAAELGPRPWRELVDELRNDAPGAGRDARRLPAASSTARARSWSERDLVAIPDGAGGRRRHAVVPRVAGALRRLRAAADLPRRASAAASTSRRPTRRCRPRRRRSSGAGTAATRIPAMVAHEAYPGHHLQLVTAQEPALGGPAPSLDAGHGRGVGALLRAAHGRGRATTGRPSSGSSSW